MAENQEAQANPEATHEGEHHDHFKLYMTVFAALAVCTALSFGANQLFGKHAPMENGFMNMTVIMIISIIKASLVGYIFMHLKWDWAKLYFLIIPAFILGFMMVIVLLPDIVLAWR